MEGLGGEEGCEVSGDENVLKLILMIAAQHSE